MNTIETILALLHGGTGGPSTFSIPERWNCCGYPAAARSPERPGELLVDPRAFLAHSIAHQLALPPDSAAPAPRAPMTHDIIYGMLVRSLTAWPHADPHRIEGGTFLKTMALLPHLREEHVTIVYLLPVFRCSTRYRKGELGSPYAIRDIYRLDPALHDPLLGPYSKELLETEFKAFVDLCHHLGMRVVLDVAFRTVARDSDLIATHPDWFYWIRMQDAAGFRAPVVGDGQHSMELSDATIRALYTQPGTAAYLAQFTPSPDRLHPQQWMQLQRSEDGDMLDEIERDFGVTTAPGFSDVINDHQPPWTDVTYLRFYNDSAPVSRPYLRPEQPPAILQDSTSLSKYHGNHPTTALWDYVIGVLPFYRSTFGIDGARIDMAHALPAELNAALIRRIRSMDPGFLLWSEELDSGKGDRAQKDGFDCISGFCYANYKHIRQPEFTASVLGSFLCSPLPVVASVETPDTPRSALLYREPALLRLVLFLNAFMPNAVPYINSGQELLELQPMNLGLDNDERGRHVLPPEDPMAGKLAFFDQVMLHWTGSGTWVGDTLQEALRLRCAYLSLLDDPAFFSAGTPDPVLTVLCYRGRKQGLIVIANRSGRPAAFIFRQHCPRFLQPNDHLRIVHSTDGPRADPTPDSPVTLDPWGVVLIDINQGG